MMIMMMIGDLMMMVMMMVGDDHHLHDCFSDQPSDCLRISCFSQTVFSAPVWSEKDFLRKVFISLGRKRKEIKPTLVLRQRPGRKLEDFGKLENACFGMLELPKLWNLRILREKIKQPKPCLCNASKDIEKTSNNPNLKTYAPEC